MFHDILFLLLGLVLIIAGGSYVTDGAEAIARRFKISSVIIGLTVVAFGSSTPDFVVAFTSTLEHKASLAIGDVVGANIFDLLLVVGIMGIVRNIPLSMRMRNVDLPLLLLSSLAIFFCADDTLLDGTKSNIVSRTDGLLLLGFFVIYMRCIFSVTKSQSQLPPPACVTAKPPHELRPISYAEAQNPPKQAATDSESKLAAPTSKKTLPDKKTDYKKLSVHKLRFSLEPPADMKMWVAVVCVLAGLAALVIGGNWIVDGASGLALKAGMTEAMVGLTIVAIGSSVPDLATSLIAVLKNQPGIALGNVVGSCAFNVFFIIGACATTLPMHINQTSFVDFAMLVLASLLLCIFSFTKKMEVNRKEGMLLVLVYIAYFTWLVVNAACK